MKLLYFTTLDVGTRIRESFFSLKDSSLRCRWFTLSSLFFVLSHRHLRCKASACRSICTLFSFYNLLSGAANIVLAEFWYCLSEDRLHSQLRIQLADPRFLTLSHVCLLGLMDPYRYSRISPAQVGSDLPRVSCANLHGKPLSPAPVATR
jgi:hypothetical protein